MKLSVSSAARTRDFSRMMRRLNPSLTSLSHAFESVTLQHPIHEAILITVAQDLPATHFEERPNSDGYFQVFVGWPKNCDTSPAGDAENTLCLFDRVRRVVAACPFSDPDREATLAALDDWAADNRSSSS
jgi:hypothetical protein